MPLTAPLPAENTDPWYDDLVAAWAAMKLFVDGLETAVGQRALQSALTSGLSGKAALAHTHVADDIISGILADARIPNLSATKVTGGVFDIARIPDIAKAKVTGLVADLAAKADLVGGLIPTSQLPAIAITEFKGAVASQAAMLALTGEKGDWAIRTDNSTTWIITGDTPSNISSWTQIQAPTGGGGAVTSVNGETGIVVLTAAEVGARPDTWVPAIADVTGLTAALAGKVDTSRTINGHALTADITLTYTDVGAASAAQGAKADTAVQPEDLGTAAAEDSSAFATAAQGALADTAVQPATLTAAVAPKLTGQQLTQAAYDAIPLPKPAGVYVIKG